MASELKPVYLLAGSDRPKIARALARLRAQVGEQSVERLSAATASGDDVVAACNAFGLFASEARLVVVDDAGRWGARDVKALASYLADPAPGTVLALVADEAKPDSPLAKACAPAGDLLLYDVVKKRLPDWVGEQFRRLGAPVERDVCELLVHLVGDDLTQLESEIDKLVTWAAGDPITARDVEVLAYPSAETPIFALTDAWGRRDVSGVLAACEALLDRSGATRASALSRLAGSLAAHVSRVRACQALAAEGVRPRDAAARLKIHRFAAEKAFAHASEFSTEELRAAVVRLAELDLALKGGSRLSGDLELERALVDITRPARPAAAMG